MDFKVIYEKKNIGTQPFFLLQSHFKKGLFEQNLTLVLWEISNFVKKIFNRKKPILRFFFHFWIC